jgi:hypothetical protein
MTDDYDDNVVYGDEIGYVPCFQAASAVPTTTADDDALYGEESGYVPKDAGASTDPASEQDELAVYGDNVGFVAKPCEEPTGGGPCTPRPPMVLRINNGDYDIDTSWVHLIVVRDDLLADGDYHVPFSSHPLIAQGSGGIESANYIKAHCGPGCCAYRTPPVQVYRTRFAYTFNGDGYNTCRLHLKLRGGSSGFPGQTASVRIMQGSWGLSTPPDDGPVIATVGVPLDSDGWFDPHGTVIEEDIDLPFTPPLLQILVHVDITGGALPGRAATYEPDPFDACGIPTVTAAMVSLDPPPDHEYVVALDIGESTFTFTCE